MSSSNWPTPVAIDSKPNRPPQKNSWGSSPENRSPRKPPTQSPRAQKNTVQKFNLSKKITYSTAGAGRAGNVTNYAMPWQNQKRIKRMKKRDRFIDDAANMLLGQMD